MTGNKKKIIDWLIDQRDTIFIIKEKKQSRTLNQNNYYWQLLGELSNKLRVPSDELHFELIKKSCPFIEIMIPAEQKIIGIKYYEVLKTIKKNDKIYNIVRVYAGSSEINTIEFGILLDNLIEECTDQGINTLTPDEIKRLKAIE